MFGPDHPLIVQGDGSILLDAHHSRADDAKCHVLTSPVTPDGMGAAARYSARVGVRAVVAVLAGMLLPATSNNQLLLLHAQLHSRASAQFRLRIGNA